MTIDQAFDEVTAARAALDQIGRAFPWSSNLTQWSAVEAVYVARERAAKERLAAAEAQLLSLAVEQGGRTGAA